MRGKAILSDIQACGIDEVGRGPLAGPVTAACVHIPEGKRRLRFWKDVTDSKAVPAPKRESLFDKLCEHVFFGIGHATVEEIESLNIHHATLLAMRRAFDAMQATFSFSPELALVDGKFAPALPCKAETVVGGDALHKSIAAASIIAKVTRDRIMRELHDEHPVYGWNTNVGYSTASHLAAIREHGITGHHRRTFENVRQYNLL